MQRQSRAKRIRRMGGRIGSPFVRIYRWIAISPRATKRLDRLDGDETKTAMRHTPRN